jgi:hypothetical protein
MPYNIGNFCARNNKSEHKRALVAVIAHQTTYSDWLFIYYLSCNMDGAVFRDLLHSYAKGLRKEPRSSSIDDSTETPI